MNETEIDHFSQSQIYALHGFLGRPNDWQIVFDGHPLQTNLETIDLFDPPTIQPFEPWAASMTQKISENIPKGPMVLMGYSLGGRLAMHLALHQPQMWDAVVIVSGNLGLTDERERRLRVAQDDMWALRFDTVSWKTLIQEWNARDVFQNDTFAFERRETDYKRGALSAALRCWSLGIQQDLSQQLHRLQCPVLWVAGADDVTYATQAKRVIDENLLQNPLSKVWLAPGCGHRVPWQQPTEFLSELTSFLERVNSVAHI